MTAKISKSHASQCRQEGCVLCTVLHLSYSEVLRQILCSVLLEEANISSPSKSNMQIFEGRTEVSVTILQGILTKCGILKCLFLVTHY